MAVRLFMLVLLGVRHVSGTMTKRLLLIGETGAGKSTLGNMVLGTSVFEVGHDLQSCTSSIESHTAQMFGNGIPIMVSDTGGLGDSEGRDETFVKDVASHARSLGGVHGVIYVHNACTTRLGKGAQEALLRMVHTLADESSQASMWSHVAIALTQCANRRPIYERFLPQELQTRFNTSIEMPMFWVLDAQGAMDRIMALVDYCKGSTWQQKFDLWVKALPESPLLIPEETTHEELNRKFEENRLRELEERRLVEEELQDAKIEAEDRRQQLKASESSIEDLRSQLESAKTTYDQQAATSNEELEEQMRVAEAERARSEQQYQDQLQIVKVRNHEAENRNYHYIPGRWTNNGWEGGCFGSSSVIAVKDRGTILLHEVRVGDEVSSVTGWTEVVAWMHNDPGAEDATAVEIKTTTHALAVTRDHFIFVQHGNHLLAVPAGRIRVGDVLLTGPDGSPSTVTHVANATLRGYHGPLTASGKMIVDGILASCYVDVGLPHGVVHALTAMWRLPGLPRWLRPHGATWLALGKFVRRLTSVLP